MRVLAEFICPALSHYKDTSDRTKARTKLLQSHFIIFPKMLDSMILSTCIFLKNAVQPSRGPKNLAGTSIKAWVPGSRLGY